MYAQAAGSRLTMLRLSVGKCPFMTTEKDGKRMMKGSTVPLMK